jgi:hypothetical protein
MFSLWMARETGHDRPETRLDTQHAEQRVQYASGEFFSKRVTHDCNAGMNYLEVANFLRASVSPAKHPPEWCLLTTEAQRH